MKKYLSLFLISTLFSCSTSWASQLPAPIFESVGEGGFKADTHIPLAQKYFNQGLVFFMGLII
ncbi:MAG: hypothetical protein H0U73_05300 [Tatlockia sp.]|nr:hypothetical protein [Tatlockia sp.]